MIQAPLSTKVAADAAPGHLAVRRAARFIEERAEAQAEGPVRLEELSLHCGLSLWHLQRQFKRVMGVSPRAYEEALRFDRLRRGLKAGEGVAAATFDAGFGSSSRVYERSDLALGMTPASYARGGDGMEIAFTIAPCRLGKVLVAATARGLCRVALGEEEKAMAAALAKEFPHARAIRRDDRALGTYVREILARIEGKLPSRDLPLDIRMTAFQRLVWEELIRIPAGETRSYGEIAAAIGKPGAARAVGGACADNPVAIAIPCHRALQSGGGLGGYAWGKARKQALLAAEGKERQKSG